VMYAAQRARDISGGSQILIDRDRDKNPVVALREIADVKLDQDVLKDKLISGMQKHADIDKPEEVNEMAELEQELAAALAQGGAGQGAADGRGGRHHRVVGIKPSSH